MSCFKLLYEIILNELNINCFLYKLEMSNFNVFSVSGFRAGKVTICKFQGVEDLHSDKQFL